jgi:thiosulfate reductase cytochrome b subunit
MSGASLKLLRRTEKKTKFRYRGPSGLRASFHCAPLPLDQSVALFVMVGSGLQIFRAFPSFGAKIPQKDLLHWPKAFAIGGWLGGALQWHLTFMWIYIAPAFSISATKFSAATTSKCSSPIAIIPGVWPMVKHYFFFGPKPPLREAYNPLQKQAYTSAIILGVLSVLTGLRCGSRFSSHGWPG